ncbi:MAG: hypothetical protein ACE5DM_02080 [Candidatus Nanoarchaeia archaeon]
MRKAHLDAFRREMEYLKKKEGKVLFKVHKWEVRYSHIYGDLKRLLGVAFGVAIGVDLAANELILFRDVVLITLFLLIFSYLITHHNKRRMFNEKSLLLTLEHTLILYAVSLVVVSGIWYFSSLVGSFADYLLVMSFGAFFGSIVHSYV